MVGSETPIPTTAFAPYQSLAASLLPFAIDGRDGSHDITHLLRVWKNVVILQATEGGNGLVLSASVLLHDCVAVGKDSPQIPGIASCGRQGRRCPGRVGLAADRYRCRYPTPSKPIASRPISRR